MQKRERREFQRLPLPEGIPASFGGKDVRLVEIGISGARLEHPEREIIGRTAQLTFDWEKESIAIECEVVRLALAPGSDGEGGGARLHHSGVVFVGAEETAADALRRALSSAVLERLGQGAPHDGIEDYDDTLRPSDARFLTYEFEEGVWKKRRAFLPEQPDVGFTVASDAEKGELQRLCRAYEQAGSEGRRLLRLFCELSISNAMNVPRSR
jgi:hypothetical protein